MSDDRLDAIRERLAKAVGDGDTCYRHAAVMTLAANAPGDLAYLLARAENAEQALRAIRDLPSDHDLMHNAMAKAVYTIADRALAGLSDKGEG